MGILKIAIVDDHKIIRDGLKSLLHDTPDVEFLFDACNGHEFLSLMASFSPDIVIMDMNMPVMGGEEAIKHAQKQFPTVKFIVLSSSGDEWIFRMVKALGVPGLVLKTDGFDVLLHAIRMVAGGGQFFSQEFLLQLLNKSGVDPIKLTVREKEILYLISQGLSTHVIAERLHLSQRTIEKHRSELLSKTNCSNSVSLVVYALRNKLIE